MDSIWHDNKDDYFSMPFPFPVLDPDPESIVPRQVDICIKKRPSSIRNFFKQFRCLDTLYWKNPITENNNRSWEIGFNKSGIATHFVFLLAQVFNADYGNKKKYNHINLEFAKCACTLISKLWLDFKGDLHKYVFIIQEQQQVRMTLIDDYKIVGRSDRVEVENNIEYQFKWHFWDVPALQLPESGGVMKGVRLAVMKPLLSDDDGVICSADGEKTVLWEAAREIMKQKPTTTSLEKFGSFR